MRDPHMQISYMIGFLINFSRNWCNFFVLLTFLKKGPNFFFNVFLNWIFDFSLSKTDNKKHIGLMGWAEEAEVKGDG